MHSFLFMHFFLISIFLIFSFSFTPMVNLNIFRFIGDFLAISSRISLIRKISSTNSLSGLSLKTQILYLFVYVFRYLDLLSAPATFLKKYRTGSLDLFIYNTTLKIIYIAFQIYIISQFYSKRKYTYSKKFDTFPFGIFLCFSLALAVFIKDSTGSIFFNLFGYLKELCYTCSLILETLAILPQLVVIQDSGECEKLTAIFITCLGLYRLNYFVFFYFSKMQQKRVDTLLIVSSLIQSVLYLDFYRVYFAMFK